MKPGLKALRGLLVAVAVVLSAFGYVQLAENKGYALKKGTAAPLFRLPALAGGELDLATLRGRVVVVKLLGHRTTGYPETFELDAQGVLREHYVGPAEWDTPEALEHFRRRVVPIPAGH